MTGCWQTPPVLQSGTQATGRGASSLARIEPAQDVGEPEPPPFPESSEPELIGLGQVRALVPHLALELEPQGGLELQQKNDSEGTWHSSSSAWARDPKTGGETHLVREVFDSKSELGVEDEGPIFCHQILWGNSTSLLIGWTSHGGGMSTVHVYALRRDGPKPRVVDKLAFAAPRAANCLLVHEAKEFVRFGIPKLHSYEAGMRPSVHLGGQKLDLRQASFTTVGREGARAFCPPTGRDILVGDVTWFQLRGSRFGQAAPP